jgi:FMN reductase
VDRDDSLHQPDGRIVAIVGNPRPASRTRAAAEAVAARLCDLLADPPESAGAARRDIATIDLADHGDALLRWGSPEVSELKSVVLGASGLVVASPTYKAAYTGLLKLFLDQFDKDELGGVPTVALMTGGSAAHALAVEVHLRPVLVEIGASLPTRGLFLAGPDVDEPAAVVDAWMTDAAQPLRRALAADRLR